MAERVTDLRDIERRVVAHLVGEPEPGVPMPDEPCGAGRRGPGARRHRRPRPAVVLALVTERGGPTSHTAIIARQLGIPCVVGTAGGDRRSRPAPPLLVDGATGAIELDPTPTRPHALVEADRDRARARWPPGAARARPPTAPGQDPGQRRRRRVGARRPPTGPVEGVGLFRTELCFLNRDDEPTVEEQAAIYGEVLAAFAGDRYVVVRTLDAGSDKPVAFATPEGEENPALGVRGLRLSFGNPGLLDAPARRHRRRPRDDRHRDLGDGADGGDGRRGRRVRGGQVRARGLKAGRDGRGAVGARCWPTGCSRTSTSSRSAPTT